MSFETWFVCPPFLAVAQQNIPRILNQKIFLNAAAAAAKKKHCATQQRRRNRLQRTMNQNNFTDGRGRLSGPNKEGRTNALRIKEQNNNSSFSASGRTGGSNHDDDSSLTNRETRQQCWINIFIYTKKKTTHGNGQI